MDEKVSRREFLTKAALASGGCAVFLLLGTEKRANASAPPAGPSPLGDYDWEQHSYAYLLDAQKCIDCGMCVKACKAENRVPDGFFRTWVERYEIGEDGEAEIDSPEGSLNGFEENVSHRKVAKAFFVPKMCNHCAASPCVQVCPVGATYRTPDGVVLVDLLEAARIPAKYQACTFANFQIDFEDGVKNVLLQARRRCELYVEGFVSEGEGTSSERGLLLTGPPGVGKTHLAVATIKELMNRNGVSARFLDFSSFLADIRATFDPDSSESKHRLIDPVLRVDVLLFDELGASQVTPFVKDIVYLVINGRYLARKPTIFTSNFLPRETRPVKRAGELNAPSSFDLSLDSGARHDQLADKISPMLLSRVIEMAQWVQIDAGKFDYRRHKNKVLQLP